MRPLSCLVPLVALALAAPVTASVTFSNPTPIAVPASGNVGAGSPFPSTIVVDGLPGLIVDLNVTLHDVTHSWPDDLDVLLVSPTGDELVIQADAGGGHDLAGVTYTIDDDAAEPLPNEMLIPAGRARPTAYDSSTFDGVGGPAPPYAQPLPVGAQTLESVFAGGSPNGTWSLYALDDQGGDLGEIAGGWSLELETDPPVFGNTSPIVVSEIGPAAPYPVPIPVHGLGEVESVRVTLNGVTHSYPDDLAVLLEGPSGDVLVLQSGAGGHQDADAATYLFDDLAAALPDASALPAGGASVRPTSYADPDFDLAGGPTAPYAEPFPGGPATLATQFAGQPANGAWKLWVVDCCAPDAGAIERGVSLTIEAPEASATGAGAAALLALAVCARRAQAKGKPGRLRTGGAR